MTLKPLPATALPRPVAPVAPQPGVNWLRQPEASQSAEPPLPNEIVRANLNTILMGYARGDTFEDIGATLQPPLTGMQIRHQLTSDRELRERYDAVVEHRAHHVFDLAVKTAKASGSSADLIRVAERMLPKVYGPKAEVSLVGAVKVDGELTVKMTPDEAYLKMVRGDV